MSFERIISIAGLFAVAVAAGASAFQGYISWDGRKESLRATVLAQIVKSCADFISDDNMFIDKRPETLAKIGIDFETLILISRTLPNNNISFDEEIKSFSEELKVLPSDSNADQVKPVLDQLRPNVERKCSDLIKAYITNSLF
jgi:hypothetical protein